jgi:hypothetical protein
VLNGEHATLDDAITAIVKEKKQTKVRDAMKAQATRGMLSAMERVAQRGLGLPAGVAAVVVNGGVYGPVDLADSTTEFMQADMAVLEKHAASKGKGKTLTRILQYITLTGVDADHDTPSLRSAIVATAAMVSVGDA